MWTPADRALVGDLGCGQTPTDDRFRPLEPLIPPARPGGRPRTTDMRRLLDGLFHVVRTGCRWRHRLPVAAPAAASGLPALARRVRHHARFPPGRGAGEHPPPLRGHAARGRWAGGRSLGGDHRHPGRENHGEKRLKGRKRHVAVDTDGPPLGVVVHAAGIQDADGLGDPLKRLEPLHPWLRAVSADSIHNRLAAPLACFLAGPALIIVRRAAGATGFVVQPRRWSVERSLGWFGRWRRLSKDHEALPEVSEAMVTPAMIRLMLHRLVHPNRRRLPAP
jgi:putative transposase